MRKRWMGLATLLLVVASAALAGEYLEKSKDEKLRGEPSDDAALVYVIRPSRMGSGVKFWAFAGDQLVGITKGKSYAFAHVPPGTHLFWSKAENTAALELEVAAGKTYYFKQKVKTGFGKARVKMEPMGEAEALEALETCAHAVPTEEGRARAAEIAANRIDRAEKKVAKN